MDFFVVSSFLATSFGKSCTAQLAWPPWPGLRLHGSSGPRRNKWHDAFSRHASNPDAPISLIALRPIANPIATACVGTRHNPVQMPAEPGLKTRLSGRSATAVPQSSIIGRMLPILLSADIAGIVIVSIATRAHPLRFAPRPTPHQNASADTCLIELNAPEPATVPE